MTPGAPLVSLTLPATCPAFEINGKLSEETEKETIKCQIIGI